MAVSVLGGERRRGLPTFLPTADFEGDAAAAAAGCLSVALAAAVDFLGAMFCFCGALCLLEFVKSEGRDSAFATRKHNMWSPTRRMFCRF